MEDFAIILFIYSLPAGIVVAGVWLGTFVFCRLRQFHAWEAAAPIVPGVLYALLLLGDPFDTMRHKSLSNALAEPFWCGLAYGMLFTVRTAIGARWNRLNATAAIGTVVLGSLAATWILFAFPTLPV